ncbi:MAG: hypothetical protein KGR26_04265 [Cyanobacteria bacterium REEB65]|nr:hypothetical protein [Cyanobacteria bacterium REEB65]
MPLDRNAICQALRQWLMATTGLADNKVIFDYQPGPQPEWPYVAFNPTLATAGQGLYDELQHDSGTLTHVERRTLSVSVNVYGTQGQALAIAEAAQDGLELLSVTAILGAAGLSMADKGQLKNLSALEETQFVERFEFDAQFSAVATTTTETVGEIASIGISGHLSLPAGPPATTSATIQ